MSRVRGKTNRRSDGGSLLMEAVVCLPLLLLLVSGIWQFARIWEARFFTWLAAYNAARATLVYNPRDYAWRLSAANKAKVGGLVDDGTDVRADDVGKWIFYEERGVAWLAAVNTLAWISQTEGEENTWYPFPRFKAIPYSTRIKEQVRVVSSLDPGILVANALGERDFRYSRETNGAVRVCVEFKMPLILSIFDPGLLWPSDDGGSSKSVDPPLATIGPISRTLDYPDGLAELRGGSSASPIAAFTGVEESDAKTRGKTLGRTFSLRETVVLPKPYSTDHFPLVSLEEAFHLTDSENFHVLRSGLWEHID